MARDPYRTQEIARLNRRQARQDLDYSRQRHQAASPARFPQPIDYSVPGAETRTEGVEHTWFFGPNERRIQAVIRKQARAGWACVGRWEEGGFLGLSPYTVLTFQRVRRGRDLP